MMDKDMVEDYRRYLKDAIDGKSLEWGAPFKALMFIAVDMLCDTSIAYRHGEAEGEPAIRPTEEAANAFWTYWNRNGVPHVHGYYESTWGAINAALRTSGVVRHKYGSTLQEMLASGKPPKSALNPRAAWPFPDRSEQQEEKK